MVAEYAFLLTSAVLIVCTSLCGGWLIAPGEVAGTSLAYRMVSDQKVNWAQGSGEDWATISRRVDSAANRPPSARKIHPAKR